jgi:hypothetical protein
VIFLNDSEKLLEQLKKRFSVRQADGYGVCIIIPALDYDSDWEAKLPDENQCIDYTEAGKAYTIITLPATQTPPVPLAATTKLKKPRAAQTRKHSGGEHWTPAEDALLIEVIGDCKYGRNHVIEQAGKAGKFKGRSLSSCLQRHDKIKDNYVKVITGMPERTQWKTTNERIERFTLQRDGLKCTAQVTTENGVVMRISAVITQDEAPPLPGAAKWLLGTPAIIVNDMPVEALSLLHELVEQLQGAKQ